MLCLWRNERRKTRTAKQEMFRISDAAGRRIAVLQ
jgi:hypothetical protein